MTLVETKLVNHSNTGVRITAIKCLQIIVLLLSKSSQVRKGLVMDYMYINLSALFS